MLARNRCAIHRFRSQNEPRKDATDRAGLRRGKATGYLRRVNRGPSALITESCCSIVTRSTDAAESIIGFKCKHSFPDSVFLRLMFLRFAFRGEPSRMKELIRLPGFHSRDLGEVRLCTHP
jgi:hypothetical protein